MLSGIACIIYVLVKIEKKIFTESYWLPDK